MSEVRNEGSKVEVAYFGTKNLQAGMRFEGKFSGKLERTVEGPNGEFQSITYFLENEDGSKVGINKLGNLQYLMERKLDIKEGTPITILYEGRIPNKEGKSYHTFDVA